LATLAIRIGARDASIGRVRNVPFIGCAVAVDDKLTSWKGGCACPGVLGARRLRWGGKSAAAANTAGVVAAVDDFVGRFGQRGGHVESEEEQRELHFQKRQKFGVQGVRVCLESEILEFLQFDELEFRRRPPSVT
jgi:hypothetical protein